MTYKIKKGNHAAKPSIIRLRHKPAKAAYTVRFINGAYLIPGEDQEDWNKLWGLSFNLLTNHKDSVMIGWRYNHGTRKTEFNAYCHIDGKTIYSPPIFEAPVGENVYTSIYVDYGARMYTVNVGGQIRNIRFNHQRKRSGCVAASPIHCVST